MRLCSCCNRRTKWALLVLLGAATTILLFCLTSMRTPVTLANFKRITQRMPQSEVEELLGVPNGKLAEPTWWKWARYLISQPEPSQWGIPEGGAWGELAYVGPSQFAPVLRQEEWRSINLRVFVYFDEINRVRGAICHAPLAPSK